MPARAFAFGEFTARTLQRMAKERHLLSKFGQGVDTPPPPNVNIRCYIVKLDSTIPAATSSDGGTTWDMSYANVNVYKRSEDLSELFSQDSFATITAGTLVQAEDPGGSDVQVRVFNPSETTAPANTPLVAIQDFVGDLYLIIPGSGGTTTPVGINFVNRSGETIPPHGVMYIPSDEVFGGASYYSAIKPDNNFDRFWLVNGATAVPNNTYMPNGGSFRWDIGPVAVDPTASFGSAISLGPTPGSWLASPYRLGFTPAGNNIYTVAGQSVTNCIQHHILTVLGQFYTDLSQGGSAEFEIWYHNGTKKVVAGWGHLTVFDFLMNKNDTVKKNTFGRAIWYSGVWVIDGAYCDVADTNDAQSNSPGANNLGTGTSFASSEGGSFSSSFDTGGSSSSSLGSSGNPTSGFDIDLQIMGLGPLSSIGPSSSTSSSPSSLDTDMQIMGLAPLPNSNLPSPNRDVQYGDPLSTIPLGTGTGFGTGAF